MGTNLQWSSQINPVQIQWTLETDLNTRKLPKKDHGQNSLDSQSHSK